MKLRRIPLMLAALFCAGQFANADILVLKNGERKEGKILEEKPDAIRFKYNITPKITDDKDFPRAEIQEIIKQKPEEIEIMELRKTLPTPDLLTADLYEGIIQDRLRPFVNKYPGTPQAKEIEEMIALLQEEKAKVMAGQMKREGKWISAALATRDAYNTNAYKFRRAMNEKAAAGDYVGALREFDMLRDPARGFPASMHYAQAIPEVIGILELYEKKLSRMVIEQPMLQKLRDNGLKGKVPPELTYIKRAIDKEVNEWKATYEAEKKTRYRWQTVYKYDLKSIQDAYKLVIEEKNKLMLLDQPGLVARNELLTKALQYIADGNVAEAEAVLKTAQLSIKSGQALVMQDANSIIAQLRLRLTTLKTQQAKDKTLNRTVGPGSTAVAGAGTGPIPDDRVAKAMADAEQAADAKKAGAEGEKKDDADKPADGKKTDETPKSKLKSKDKATRPKTPESEAIAAPVQQGSNTQTYLLFGAAILIVVLLVAFVVEKKKQK